MEHWALQHGRDLFASLQKGSSNLDPETRPIGFGTAVATALEVNLYVYPEVEYM